MPGLLIIMGILFGLFFIYLSIAFSLAPFIILHERSGIINGFGRSVSLITGNWWATLGLLIVLYLIIFALSIALSIPWFVVFSIYSAHLVDAAQSGGTNIVMRVMLIISFLLNHLSSLFSSIVFIALTFKYFSIVEKKEGRALLQKVESL